MKKKLLSLIALSCCLSVFAQEHSKITNCSQTEHELYLEKKNPNRSAEREAYEQQLNKWIAAHPYKDKSPQATITIPVVVHVLWNTSEQNISDAQVLSAIQVLNDDFNRTNADTVNTPAIFKPLGGSAQINWCMATIDPKGKLTNGIVHKNTTKTSFDIFDSAKKSSSGGDDAWDVSKYFNIWVVKFSDTIQLGYASAPSSSLNDTYGACISYKAFGTKGTAKPPHNKGRILTHNMGHCLDLYHTWGSDSACNGDDYVSDTPEQKGKNFGTPSFPQGSSQSGGCCNTADQSSMFMNYMDNVDDAAMNIFTKEQVTRMLAVLNTAPYDVLKNSTMCSPTDINEFYLPDNISIYPNPSNGEVFINTHNPGLLSANVTIYNAIGIPILQNSIAASLGEIKLDMKNYANGIYFIQLKTTNGIVTKKISITK